MKRRGVSDNSPVKQFIGGVYKVKAITSKLMARVRDESSEVVYKGIGEEIVI